MSVLGRKVTGRGRAETCGESLGKIKRELGGSGDCLACWRLTVQMQFIDCCAIDDLLPVSKELHSSCLITGHKRTYHNWSPLVN